MVSINRKPTARTDVDSVGQRHLLPMSTATTVLTGVGRVDSHNLPSASVYCFVLDELCELRPGCVRNRLGETMVVNHPVDFKILDADYPEAVDDASALLVGKVTPSIGNTFVNLGDNLAGLLPLWSPILSLGELSLLPGQFFLITPEELWSRDGLRGRESSKGDEAHINANSFRGRWQGSSFHFAGDANKPFTGRASLDRASLGDAFDQSVKDNPDLPDLGEFQGVSFKLPADVCLWKGEAIVAIVASEARVARSFPGFGPAKKGFKGEVKAHGYVLEHLRVNNMERRPLLFQFWKHVGLGIVVERLLSLLPGSLSLFQEMVVQPAAFI